MNRRTLETLLATVAAGQLDLPLSVLDAPHAAYLGRFLPTGRLTLTNANRTRPDPTGSVRVTGTGTAGPFAGLPVTVDFVLTGDTVTGVRVHATAGPTWSLADPYPILANTLLASLRFTAPTMTLDTAVLAPTGDDPAPDPADAQMLFSGELRIDSAMTAVAGFFSGGTHPVSGEIAMVTLSSDELPLPTPTVPRVILYGPEGETLDLGLFSITNLRYEIFGAPEINYATVDSEVAGILVLTGAIDVDVSTGSVGTQTHQVLLSAQIVGWDNDIVLAADFSGLGTLTLDDVARLAGLDSLTLPFDLSPDAGISLGEVMVSLTHPGGSWSINHIALTVRAETDWAIIDDLLELQALELTVRVDQPGPNAKTSFLVDGLLAIGDEGTLQLVANPETRQLGGNLYGDAPLRIREVYQHFTGADAGHLPPDLEVRSFQTGVTLANGTNPTSVSGEILIDGEWNLSEQLGLSEPIELTNVSFDLRHSGDETDIRAMAGFSIGQVTVMMDAAYDSAPDRKWEFSGETGPGELIPIGYAVDALAERFAGLTLPAPLADLTIDNLGVDVTTGTGRVYVTGQARFRVDGTDVAITVAVDTERRSFDGVIDLAVPTGDGTVFHPRLDVHLASDPTARRLAASYSHPDTDPVPELRSLVGAVSLTAADYVPRGIVVDPRHLLFALTQPGDGAGTAYVFGVDLKLTVDLANLPVVGEHLSGDTTIGMDLLRILATTNALSAADVTALNGLLPAEVPALPAAGLPAGFTVDGTLRLGPLDQPVALPVTGVSGTTTPPTGPVPAPANQTTTGDNAAWLPVQRAFGPVQLSRVGVAFRQDNGEDPRLALLLDASVGAAGLTLSLQGLEVGVSLTDPLTMPSFGLAGMGLSYSEGPVSITGAFLKNEIEYEGVTYPAYGGTAQLRNGELSLAAIGSYAQLPAGPSVFVYAWLDYPIGGPPFFHVRGIAAGFGYNRRLVLPPIDNVASFPLVAEATGSRTPGTTLGDELRVLSQWLPPSVGDILLTAGVHFTSFEMVDSFVLVAATFGHRFELDVLGLSTLTLPARDVTADAVTPIAEVQLALRASFVPEDGYLTVLAQLTRDSYVLSRACHLTGGIAFSTWFAGAHEGDFVLTAGGYHPHFPVPAHYPTVPRLGFNWQVTPEFSMSGSAYYALTPGALMAGGGLSAVYQDGSLRAWFDASMDFLISWQPYHYEASLHVSIGASYTYHFFGTHSINVHVGTDVDLWGPDFGGTAKIDLSVTSIRISFGADRGGGPKRLSWGSFRSTLLPAPDEIMSVTLRADSHRAAADASNDDLGLVDATTLVLRTDSRIPASRAVRGAGTGERTLGTGPANTRFGVGPMGVATGDATATHRITIKRTIDDGAVDDRFDYQPVVKSLPAALWGGRLTPSATDPALLPGMLSGYTITPRPTTNPDPVWIDRAALQADTALFQVSDAIRLATPAAVPDAGGTDADRAKLITGSLRTPAVAAARADVLAALLPDASVDLTGFDTSQFHEIPRVAAHA
ncbi:DUF6603 domain-containing protein [Micromonospora sp. NPDC050417]|uniref:DUF6603 domain-containing protein n=1 Tax=Micromonospora sp. NPDC050417 TaxID=3364280 RepID=UPI00378C56EE